ncbi:hypothetical protein [Flavobacterium sp. HJSW_4]|uniref:hypothetical protein n=1 Tax=Flavobacterium sp. HJSW_4 TaxID=3344660 RepID=UPI0035F3DA30
MYTEKQAEQLCRYYSNIIIGKPIYRFKLESPSITAVRIEEISSNEFDIICYTKSLEGIGFFRDIRSAAKELGLPAPAKILAG